MKSRFIKQLSLALSASMIISATPVNANLVSKQNKAGDASQTTEENSEKSIKYEEGQAIVMFKGSSEGETSAFAKSLGSDFEVTDTYQFDLTKKGETSSLLDRSNEKDVTVALVKSKTGESTEQLVEKLGKVKDVMYAEPNYIVNKLDMDDPYYGYQWALDNKGQNNGTPGCDINADSEELTDKDDTQRVVAVIDTGIDYNHDDLQDVIWENPFNNNKLVGEHGFDFVNFDSDPLDDNGHGTHCSGIIAGKSNNGVGIAGTAKSNNIKIMALKFLDAEGSGDLINAVGAYNYIYKAQNLGVNVVAINNSWGATGVDEGSYIFAYVMDKVGDLGAVSVCAAGNDSSNNDEIMSIPSNTDSEYVISVAATNEKDELAEFSNYGNQTVDIGAPGADILSSVSYPCFNPGIYTNKDELCTSFENFDQKELVQVSENSIGQDVEENQIPYVIKKQGSGEVSVDITDEDFFESGDGNSTSLKWSISGTGDEDSYDLYIPYNASEGKDLFSSAMIKVVGPTVEIDPYAFFQMLSVAYVGDCKVMDDGTIEESTIYNIVDVDNNNYWSHLSGKATSNSDNEKRAMHFFIQAAVAGDYTMYIDNIGVSKTNLDENNFGKYDYYNGTSMATPYVAGAVAAVANAYPDEGALDIKHRIQGSIRKSSALEGKVANSGVLDLTNIGNPAMSLRNAYLDNNEICLEGNFLEGATLQVNGTDVSLTSQDSKRLTFDAENYKNQILSITLQKDDDTLNREFYFLSGEGFDTYSAISGDVAPGQLVAAGDQVYYVDKDGNVKSGTPSFDEEGNQSLLLEYLESGYNPELFGDSLLPVNYMLTNITDVVCMNDKLYTVLEYNEGFADQKVVAEFSREAGWSKLCDLPEGYENFSGYTLAAFNGSLYLMGGADSNGVFLTSVMKYDFNKGWIKDNEMPEGRYGSQAIQVGKSLVVTLGVNSDNMIPANFIYDGSNWTVSNAELGGVVDKTQINVGENIYDVANAQFGLVANGILYTGLRADNLGDVFIYDLQKDAYESTGHILDVTSLQNNVSATTLSDRLYVVSGTEIDYDFEEDSEGNEYTSDSYITEIFTMPVNNGYVTVTDKSSKGGSVTGTGDYLPGDTITLEANVEAGYTFTSLSVNGKVCEGKTFTGLASDYPNGIEAVVNTVSPKAPDPQTPAQPSTPDQPAQPTETPTQETPKVKAPAKAKFSKVKRASNGKSVKVSYKKVKGVKGYEIRYSTSKKFTSKTTKKLYTKKTFATIKKLKASKKYYVQVRAYKMNGKKKVYGKWSSIKTVNVVKKK